MLRVAWELYLMVGMGKMLILGHIVSSVPKNHGVFRPLSLDTLIDGGQRQVDHARACVPCPIKGGVGGAAHGTMQGRGVLFPESGLELTAYLVSPRRGGLCPGFSSGVAEISGGMGGGGGESCC